MSERFTPRMFIDWWAKEQGQSVQEFGVSPIVVVSWQLSMIRALADTVGAKIPKHWFYGERYPLYTGRVEGRNVSFVYLPVGAPGTVMIMEEMIASGARAFIGLGYAGSLQENLPVGSIIIPTSCIVEEGTSRHYLDRTSGIAPAPKLVRILRESCEEDGLKPALGPHWTTDAPYRETLDKITNYHDQGVLGVDMETSAMYTLGQVRNVEVCNLLVVSDELWNKWDPAFGTDRLREAAERARNIVLRSVGKISFDH